MQGKGKNSDLMLNCSVCSGAIEDRSIILVDEKEARTIFHSTCQKCLTATLIFLSQTEKGMMSVGMATDLNRDEVQEMFSRNAISADEVIEVYRLVNKDGEQRANNF